MVSQLGPDHLSVCFVLFLRWSQGSAGIKHLGCYSGSLNESSPLPLHLFMKERTTTTENPPRKPRTCTCSATASTDRSGEPSFVLSTIKHHSHSLSFKASIPQPMKVILVSLTFKVVVMVVLASWCQHGSKALIISLCEPFRNR